MEGMKPEVTQPILHIGQAKGVLQARLLEEPKMAPFASRMTAATAW